MLLLINNIKRKCSNKHFVTYNFALYKCTHSRISSLKKFMFIKAMAKNVMYKVPGYFRVCFVIIIVREESQIVLKFRRNL